MSRRLLPGGLLLAGLAVAGCSVLPNNGQGLFPKATPAVSLAPATPVPASGSLAELQAAYVNAVKKVLPSVVQIETDNGLGSGVVFDRNGDIVTNDHVVSGATSFTVTLAGGQKSQASLVGSFPQDDLAVIRISGQSVTPATFADSSTLQVGDIAIAAGNPLGLRSSVTSGIVSAVGRTVSEGNGVTLPDAIQTSAEINPGNSGGALVDIAGDVIGIPTLVAADPQLGGTAQGIGFAIPSNTVRDIAAQLIQSGKVTNSHRAYLGVRVATSVNSSGAVVSQVVSGGPADKAGLKAGDIITKLDDTTVDGAEALTSALAAHQPGDTVKLTVQSQGGGTRTVSVTLGQLPG
jgi:putative serine protease PepD